MADPGAGADTAGGLAAPPPSPPQPPPQAETNDTNMCGAGAPTEARTAGQPPLQAEASGAGAQPPRVPLQERAAAAEAENMPAAPPPPQEQQHDSNANDEEGSAMTKPRPSRWPRVRPAVLWLLSLFHLRSQLTEQPKIPPPPPEESGGAAGLPDNPATEKDDGEGSKRRRHEEEATSMSASGRKEFPPTKPHQTKQRPRMKKKLQNAGSLVMKTMAWYRRHRSPEKLDKPVNEAAAQNEKVEETKPSTSPAPQEEETKSKQDKTEETTKQEPSKSQEKKSHPRWGKEEVRLENILEEAFTRLVVGEFTKLDGKKQQCLLTFSVFPLGGKVKKQAVTYWWATQFVQPTDKGAGADDIFSMLSGDGFLEPIKNRASGVIHGCRVNPLVHWTVKHLAREKEFADLEGDGNPADEQPKSAVLCLTAGSRDWLQNLRKHDESKSQGRPKPPGTKKTSKEPPEVGGPSQDLQSKPSLEDEKDEIPKIVLPIEFDKKRVILNISAHVYRLPELLLSKLFDRLEVLQLGRWWNFDDKTYMEVEGLEYIGKLKNLRYLSLRGLSRMTELPSEFKKLRQLTILDVRGCQNLVKVSSSTIKNLKGLTHLDLSECYMLEHIGREITALSELQVFKGFVFGVGAWRGKACRVSDLVKLRKLRKLSINITTDATVGKGEMKQLEKLTGLLSLTVTWGEVPSILQGDDKRLSGLLERWTDLILPPNLEKLDVRCYPSNKLPDGWFRDNKKLKKFYVRGGELEELIIPSKVKIETLRLRYLNKFSMQWDKMFDKLNWDDLKFVEVVDMDQKIMMNQTKGKGEKVHDEQRKKRGKDEEERIPIKRRMGIPGSTLDEKGVWVRDKMEKYGRGQAPGTTRKEDAFKTTADTEDANVPKDSHKATLGDGDSNKEKTEGQESNLRGTEEKDEPPNEEDGGDTTEDKRVDGGDEKGLEMVMEEQGTKKVKEEEERYPIKSQMRVQESTLDENGARVRNEKKLKEDEKRRTSSAAAIDQTVAPVSGGDVKKGVDADDSGTDKSSEPLKASQAPPMAPKQDATKTEAATGAADIPKVSDKGGEGDDDGRDGGAEAEDDKPATEEDRRNVGELKKFDGGDADKARTEGEDEDEGEGEAAAEPKEPGKAGGDDGLGGTGTTDTRSSARDQVGVNSPGPAKN